jgi:protein gp37
MNNISKTIGWADLSWNPIKGLCPVGCWYCYARAIYKRFHLDPKPWLDIATLKEPLRFRPSGKRVFVCSTFDLFHPVVDSLAGNCVLPDEIRSTRPARDLIFDVIGRRLDLTFIILTKLPERIDRPMPPNVWLGVSISGPGQLLRWKELQRHKATVRFISAEPLFDPYSISAPFPDWLIIGRLTGHGKKDDPSREALAYIQADCKRENVPLFMKSNLAEIWPFKLTQEWPR